MRIISEFKDYYDSVQAFGQDDTLIWNRRTVGKIKVSGARKARRKANKALKRKRGSA